MNHFYTEDYLRSQVSKYANERIQFIGSDGTSIKICFKEGYGTSLITGTVNTEVSVKTMMALKEVCKKSHLIKGEQVLKGNYSIYQKTYHQKKGSY